MKELISLLNDLSTAQEQLKQMGVHIYVGLKPSGNSKPQKSLAARPMPMGKSMSSAEKILETAAASAADGKISRATLSADCRAQWGLSGQMIGQGLRSLVVNKYMKYDKVSGIYKIL